MKNVLTLRWTMIALLAIVNSALAAAPPVETQGLDLGTHNFDWSGVEQDDDGDRANFEWFAEVTNNGNRDLEVEVRLLLLDEDDQVVCPGTRACEFTDSVRVTVQAGASRRVEHTGSMPYARAADVFSLRFRLQPDPRPDA